MSAATVEEELAIVVDAAPSTTFTQIPLWILSAKISDGAFRTWTVVRSFAFRKDDQVWPSIRTIAEIRECGRSTIARHLTELEGAGVLLRKADYWPSGGRKSSLITLAWDRPFNVPDVLIPVLNKNTTLKASPFPPAATELEPVAVKPVPPSTPEGFPPSVDNEPSLSQNPDIPPSHIWDTKEEDPQRSRTPLTPNDESPSSYKQDRGAAAPRTPSKKTLNRTRADGTNLRATGENPRAKRSNDRALLEADEARRREDALEVQAKKWARNLRGVVECDEFTEMVNGDLNAGRIDGDYAATALAEFNRVLTAPEGVALSPDSEGPGFPPRTSFRLRHENQSDSDEMA